MAVNNPRTTANLAGVQNVMGVTDYRVLIVGQMISGTATAGVLESNIPNDASEDTRWGATSQMAKLVRMYKKSNRVVQVDGIGIADNGSTKRVDLITFVGNATAAGTFEFNIGGAKDHTFSLSVASGDAIATTAAAARDLINADTRVPFVATATSGVLTLTAANAGTLANDYPIEVTGGDGTGTVATHTSPTPGATDPTASTLATALTSVGETRYQVIIWPFLEDGGSNTSLGDFLDLRFNPDAVVKDGRGFVTINDSHANILTNLGTLNNKNLVVGCYQNNATDGAYEGPHIKEWPQGLQSYFAGVVALRMTDAVSVSQYVTTNASLDQFGGAAHASLPFFNTPMKGAAGIVDVGKGFTDAEIEQITDAGGMYTDNNLARTEVITGEVPTTYKTDSGGNPDETWKFMNYALTGSVIREFYWTNLRARYAQSRLTTGDVKRGRDMANEVGVIAFCEKLYIILSGANYTLVESGDDAIKFFKENLDVIITKSTGKITISGIFPIVTQGRTINMTIKVGFDLETTS